MGNCLLIPTKPVHNDVKPVKNCSPGDGGVGDGRIEPPGDGGSTKLKVFSLAELKSATRNFREDSVVGEGGFGRVYKGYIDEKTCAPTKYGHGMPVAVKKSNPNSEQGHKEWQAEVELLGKFRHRNLVKLLGYCWEENQFLLVYEYMQGGSLEAHLFPESQAKAIPWDTRIKIAMEAARGLAFLHSTGDKNVIFRDFKASNILLDREFNAKISDFGLAKLGPAIGNSHITTQIVGTYGYAAPEYIATGHLYIKSDVYGFGVVLLEILTGLRVHDRNRGNGQMNLVEWAKPLLPLKRRLPKLIDARLEGQYPSKGAHQMAVLILSCVESNPRRRPNMEEVLKTLEEISGVKMKPKLLGAKLNQDQCRRRGRGGDRGDDHRSSGA